MNTVISPRIDYQLSANHTLVARFEERLNELDNQGLGRYALPPPYNSSMAYNMPSNSQNLMLTETAVISPKIVNETRFQFVRQWTASEGNEIPAIDVANFFITGGNGIGNEHDLSKHFELQNYTSISAGAIPSASECASAASPTRTAIPPALTALTPLPAASSRCSIPATRSFLVRPVC